MIEDLWNAFKDAQRIMKIRNEKGIYPEEGKEDLINEYEVKAKRKADREDRRQLEAALRGATGAPPDVDVWSVAHDSKKQQLEALVADYEFSIALEREEIEVLTKERNSLTEVQQGGRVPEDDGSERALLQDRILLLKKEHRDLREENAKKREILTALREKLRVKNRSS